MKKKIISLLLFITVASFTFPKNIILEKHQYEKCITHIKEQEGFRSKPYVLFNHSYIGYGHLIKNNESFIYINKHRAEMLLKNDFNKCIKHLSKYCIGNKLLSISMLAYNVGIHKVVSYIENNGILNNYSLILEYDCYKNKGEVKHSRRLKERRAFEYALFYE